MRLFWCFFLLPLCAASALAQSDLDRVVASALQTFHVPGMAVGVIDDGHVLVSKGYGVRKQGTSLPVTDRTLFGIASNTKAFTSAALAILVDEKKISWDERVVDVVPDFQMSDPYVTREMRVRDLLCHRSGLSLGAGDLMLFPDATLTVPEFLRHLRWVPIANSFRSQYAYDNVLYTVAGQVIERASGEPWDVFIRHRIFQPLAMTASRTSAQELKPDDDFATPHSLVDGQLQEYPLANLGPGAPAGSINSSIQDLMKWVNLQLHEGQYPGGRLFSAAQSREMWTPHIFIPIPATWAPETATLRPDFQAYGLGWVIYDYHGQRIVSHTGGLGGMVTRVTLVPARKLGVVVLTNQEDGAAFQSVTLAVLDYYLNVAPHTDWVAAYSAVEKRRASETEATVSKAAAQRNAASRPSLPLAKYAGRYRDRWYGDIAISQEGDGLVMRFSHSPRLTGKLEHFQYDTFIARWNDRKLAADAYVTFALQSDGSIQDVRMQPVSPATDFSFDFQDLDLKPVTAEAPPF